MAPIRYWGYGCRGGTPQPSACGGPGFSWSLPQGREEEAFDVDAIRDYQELKPESRNAIKAPPAMAGRRDSMRTVFSASGAQRDGQLSDDAQRGVA